jgi:hypothetical protein
MDPICIGFSITNFSKRVFRRAELTREEYGDVALQLSLLIEQYSHFSSVLTALEEAKLLWIDYRCIGQQDYAERGKKVSQMNQIYRDYSSERRFEDRREQLVAFRAIVEDCNRSLKEPDRMCVVEESLSQISDADDPNRVLQHLTPKSRTTPHLYKYSRNANRTRSSKPVIMDTGSMGGYLVSRELLGNLRPPMKGFGNIAHPGTELLLWTNNDRQNTDELILERLHYSKPGMDSRYETIQEAHAKTFEWGFLNSEDVVWPWDQFSQSLRDGKGLFWISRKPGSRKLTLMRRTQNNWQRYRQADSNPHHKGLHFWALLNASRRSSNWMGALRGSVMSGGGPATRYDEMGLPMQREREIGLDPDLVNLDVLYQYFMFSFSSIFNDLARVVTNYLYVIRSLFHRQQFRSATRKRFRFGMMDFGKPGLVSLLLYASPVTATSVGTANHSYGGMNDCASFLDALRHELEELSSVRSPFENEIQTNTSTQLFSSPQQPLPRPIPPHTLLLGCFFITAFTAILYTMIRAKPLTKFFLLIGILASMLTGAMFAVDLPDFVFRYLFVGTNITLVGSVWYHRFQGNKNMAQNRGFEAGMEEGKDVLEKKSQSHD